jgi:Na+/melibiose symporter-like transporter
LRGFFLPILTSAAIAAVAALWSVFVLKESHAPGRARPLPKWGDAFHFVVSHSLLARLFAIAFIGIGAFASMEAVFGLWTAANFGWTTHEVGLTFISVGATGFLRIVMPPLLGLAYSAGGPDWPYYVCTGLVGLAFMFGTQVIAIRDGELHAKVA